MTTAIFYQYNGNPNTVNKKLPDGVDARGVLFNPFDILNPTLKVRQSVGLEMFNYVYIPDFNRYYFVVGFSQIATNEVTVKLRVDVLKSYEKIILEAEATLTASNNPNPHISTRSTVYDMKPNFEKVDFPNRELLSRDGTIIMVTIKGNV